MDQITGQNPSPADDLRAVARSAEARGGPVFPALTEHGPDPESREWLDGLRSPPAERHAVLARLHGLLLHAARHEAARRNGWLRLSGPDLDHLARQRPLRH